MFHALLHLMYVEHNNVLPTYFFKKTSEQWVEYEICFVVYLKDNAFIMPISYTSEKALTCLNYMCSNRTKLVLDCFSRLYSLNEYCLLFTYTSLFNLDLDILSWNTKWRWKESFWLLRCVKTIKRNRYSTNRIPTKCRYVSVFEIVVVNGISFYVKIKNAIKYVPVHT